MDNTIVRNEILDIFLSKSSHHKLSKPHSENGFVYASNGHVCIKIQESRIPEKITPQENPIKYEAAYKGCYDRLSQNYRFRLNDLKEAFEVVKLYPVRNECPECEGEGIIECDHCGHDSDCDKCGGSGEYGEVIGYEPDDYYNFILLGIIFSAINIQKLIKAAEYFDTEIINLETSLEPLKAALFMVKDIEILVMPIMKVSEDPNKEREIIINPIS